MTVHWSLISLALAAVAVVDLVGCGWVLRHRGAIGRVSVAVLLGAAGTWCLAYGLELATEPGVREFWVVGEYLASTVLPPAWLIFVLRYTGHRWRITRQFLGLLAAEPLIVLGLLAAPATRGLVQYYGTETAGPLPSVRFGPAYWTHFLYVNALVLLASGRLVVTLTRISPMYRRQTRTLLAAVILPMIANALSSFSVGPFRWFDPTPVAVSASGWVIVWGAFRFRLLDLLPVARTTVFERMSDGVLVIDAYRRIVDLNPAAQSILGAAAAVGRPVAAVLPDAIPRLAGGPGVSEVQLGHAPGARHFQLTVSRLGGQNDDQAGHLLLLRDVTERKEAEDRLRWLANYDPLTHLPNRRLFADRFAQALAGSRRHGTRGAVVLIDLDGFKLINDSLGHPVGDELLVTVAERLRRSRREQDTAARLGGDEFAVLLPEIRHPEDAGVVAAKILASFAQPIRIAGYDLNITASIGVAVWPDDGVDQHVLLSSADAALYQAKAHGKNRYELANRELGELAGRRLRLATELREALAGDGLRLLYQPYVDLGSGDVVGMEALVRWKHPSGALLAPATFFPVAEEAGLAATIDRWVLTQACIHAGEWTNAARRPVSVAVNISPQGFADRLDQLQSEVETALARSGLPASRLTLEINERTMIENYATALPELGDLKSLGVSLALDDFGAGYTSLNQLRRLPLDVLKVDRGLVEGLGAASEDGRIVSAIISLAHILELTVLAEGVERHEQLFTLNALGCDWAQGFLLSPPVTPGAAATLAARPASDLLAGPVSHRG